MSKAGAKIIEGLRDALAYARIRALWLETKKQPGEDVSSYDWGYKDGLEAAMALFGSVPDDESSPAEKTRRKVALSAEKILKSRTATKAEKSAAASALTQKGKRK